MSEFKPNQPALENTESNKILKNHIKENFTLEFRISDNFYNFIKEIFRLLAIIKINEAKSNKDIEFFETEIIDEILSDCQNSNDSQKQHILLGHLKAFAGENYNSRNYLGRIN